MLPLDVLQPTIVGSGRQEVHLSPGVTSSGRMYRLEGAWEDIG